MPSKPRTRRDLAKERSWRQIIRRQQRSGLSVRAFCEEEGLKESAFRWWQGGLRRRERGSPSAPPESSHAKPTVGTMPPTFLPVRVVEGNDRRPFSKPGSWLQFRHG